MLTNKECATLVASTSLVTLTMLTTVVIVPWLAMRAQRHNTALLSAVDECKVGCGRAGERAIDSLQSLLQIESRNLWRQVTNWDRYGRASLGKRAAPVALGACEWRFGVSSRRRNQS